MRRTLNLLVVLVLGAMPVRAELPNYAVSQPLGLTDAKHTAANGRRSSRVWFAGGKYAVGSSDAYKGNQTFGSSVWWHDGARIVRLGFTGFDYTGHSFSTDGIQQSYARGINSSGVTIGYSARNPTTSYAYDGTPWVWDGTTLSELGPDGPEYRDAFNRRSAGVALRGINDAGDIIGSSGRYSNGQSIGTRPWLRRNGVYVPLGLSGGDYTMNGGYEYSEIYKLNQAGQVLGASQQADAQSYIGWIYEDGVYKYVGLVTPENEQVTPFNQSWPQKMNEAGQAAGIAMIWANGSINAVEAVWFYDGVESRRVGLTGDEFTGDGTGYQSSELTTLTESGYLLGTSALYPQSYGLGRATWVSDGVATRRTGLWDAQHTRSDGWQFSSAYQINSTGQSAGFSDRYSGAAHTGATAWVDDGSAIHVVGRYGAEYTRADGYQSSYVELLNESGDAVGYSIRYNGSTEAGRTGWFYDAETETLTDVLSSVASSNPSFGNYVSFSHLGEDGSVFGEYLTHPGGAIDSEGGLFAWTPSGGLITFEDHVKAGLENWDRFGFLRDVDGAGFLGGGWTGPNADSLMAFRAIELMAADLDFDQSVDAEDLGIILNDFGSIATAGDVDGNGGVDGHDFLIWQRQLNATSAALVALVPEPSSAVAALAGLLSANWLTLNLRRPRAR